MTLARASRLCYGGSNKVSYMIDVFQGTENELQELLDCPALAEFEWKERLRRYCVKRDDIKLEESHRPSSSIAAQEKKTDLSTKEWLWSEVQSSSRVLTIIEKLVYDVTDYLDEHPGGSFTLLDSRGRDATKTFEEVLHSQHARTALAPLCVGCVKTSVDVGPSKETLTETPSEGPAVITIGSGNKHAVAALAIAKQFVAWEITTITSVTHDCLLFELSCPQGSKPPAFLTPTDVWHLSVRSPEPDPQTGRFVCRQYSPISSSQEWADHDRVRLVIKIYPDGKLTSQLKALQVGGVMMVARYRLTLSVPSLLPTGGGIAEQKSTDDKTDHVENFPRALPAIRRLPSLPMHGRIFVAIVVGGTGACPALPLLNILLTQSEILGFGGEICTRLIYSSKSEKDVLFRHELDRFAAKLPANFRLLYTVTRTKEQNNKQASLDKTTSSGSTVLGRVSLEMARWLTTDFPQIASLSEHKRVVICGPNSFGKDVAGLMRQVGFSQDECVLLDA